MAADPLIDRSAPDPALSVCRDDAWQAALQGLSAMQRTVVMLRVRYCMTFAEIAFVVGLTKSGAHAVFEKTIDLLKQTGKYRALVN